MKKATSLLALLGLVVGFAQAQTPQAKLLWERTFPANVALALDAADTIKGPTISGWHLAGKSVTIGRNGNVTEAPMDVTQGLHRISASRRGRYTLQVWYHAINEGINPFRTDQPGRVEVHDRTGRVVFSSDQCWGEEISDNGTLVWPGRDTIVFYGLDGHVKSKRGYGMGMAVAQPFFLSDDGSRTLVYVKKFDEKTPNKAVVIASSGRVILEVPAETNCAMRPDGAILVTQYLADSVKKAMFYDRDGKIRATWTLNGMGFAYDYNPVAFSEDGNYAAVFTTSKIVLLQINPSKIVWEFSTPNTDYWFDRCWIGPQGKYLVASLRSTKKVWLFDQAGKPIWQPYFPGLNGVAMSNGFLLVTQGPKVSLFKINVQ